jgi:hypothetical protein
MFPNAGWNREASWMLWILGIALVVSTLGYCVFVAIRLISRHTKFAAPPHLAQERTPKQRFAFGAIIILATSAFVASLLVLIEHKVRSSPVYQASVARAQGSSVVLEQLGSPVNVGWFVQGQLSESTDGSGSATLTIPLEGPKGGGKLRVRAARQARIWRFSILRFIPNGNSPAVDLLSGLPEAKRQP